MGLYYEPWRARKSVARALSFRTPPDDPEARARWEADKAAAEREAPSLIWGTGVWEPADTTDLISGKPVHFDSTGIIVTVRPVMTQHGRLDAEAFAQRIAACINYWVDVDLHQTGFNSLRALLAELRALHAGISKSTLNDLWKPRWPPEPEVFPEQGPPQGTKVRKPRRKKRNPFHGQNGV